MDLVIIFNLLGQVGLIFLLRFCGSYSFLQVGLQSYSAFITLHMLCTRHLYFQICTAVVDKFQSALFVYDIFLFLF